MLSGEVKEGAGGDAAAGSSAIWPPSAGRRIWGCLRRPAIPQLEAGVAQLRLERHADRDPAVIIAVGRDVHQRCGQGLQAGCFAPRAEIPAAAWRWRRWLEQGGDGGGIQGRQLAGGDVQERGFRQPDIGLAGDRVKGRRHDHKTPAGQNLGHGLVLAAEGARTLAGVAVKQGFSFLAALGHGRWSGRLLDAGMQAVNVMIEIQGQDAGGGAQGDRQSGVGIALCPFGEQLLGRQFVAPAGPVVDVRRLASRPHGHGSVAVSAVQRRVADERAGDRQTGDGVPDAGGEEGIDEGAGHAILLLGRRGRPFFSASASS